MSKNSGFVFRRPGLASSIADGLGYLPSPHVHRADGRQHVARDVQRPILGFDLVEADDASGVLDIFEGPIPAEDFAGVLPPPVTAPPAKKKK